jgi:hypothetical protein
MRSLNNIRRTWPPERVSWETGDNKLGRSSYYMPLRQPDLCAVLSMVAEDATSLWTIASHIRVGPPQRSVVPRSEIPRPRVCVDVSQSSAFVVFVGSRMVAQRQVV